MTSVPYESLSSDEKEVVKILKKSGGTSSTIPSRLANAVESLKKKGVVKTETAKPQALKSMMINGEEWVEGFEEPAKTQVKIMNPDKAEDIIAIEKRKEIPEEKLEEINSEEMPEQENEFDWDHPKRSIQEIVTPMIKKELANFKKLSTQETPTQSINKITKTKARNKIMTKRRKICLIISVLIIGTLTGFWGRPKPTTKEINSWVEKGKWSKLGKHLKYCKTYPDAISQKDLRTIRLKAINQKASTEIHTLIAELFKVKGMTTIKPPPLFKPPLFKPKSIFDKKSKIFD